MTVHNKNKELLKFLFWNPKLYHIFVGIQNPTGNIVRFDSLNLYL